MNQPIPDTASELVAETDPYELLGLQPSAPQDLIDEVYWHVAHSLRMAAATDPGARTALAQLNDAYALTIRRQDAGEARKSLDEQNKGSNGGQRIGWFGRLRGKTADPVHATAGPSALLRVTSSASPAVIQLAYDFWRRRLQDQLGYDDGPELDTLTEAYEAILALPASDALSEAPPAPVSMEKLTEAYEAIMAPPALDNAPSEALPPPESITLDSPAQPAEGAFSEKEDVIETPAAEANTPVPTADGAEATPMEVEPQPSIWSARIRPGAVAVSAAMRHRTGVVLDAGWERLKTWAADPFHEYDPSAPPKPPAAETPARPPDFDILIEQRVDALPAGYHTDGSSVEKIEDAGRGNNADSLAASEGSLEDDGDGGEVCDDNSAVPHMSESVVADGSPHAELRYVGEETEALLIGAQVLSIGTDPACDIVVECDTRARKKVAARLWARDDGVVLHVIADEPAVLVNGKPVFWVLLEDGDQLQVGQRLRLELQFGASKQRPSQAELDEIIRKP